MHILFICGSTAQKSHTHAILKYIEELVKKSGHDTFFWDLRGKPLPIARPEFHKNPRLDPDKRVGEFVEAVEKADGIIIGSPLYHGSYSGVLKNALDNLPLDAFRNKAIGLIGHGSSSQGSTHPPEHLRSVVRAMFGYALQTQIGTGTEAYSEEQDTYILSDETIKTRCERLVKELIALTTLYKEHTPNRH